MQKRRPIRMPSTQRLQNIALHYLSKYAASEASLRRVLQNRLRRAAMALPEYAADHAKQAEMRQAIEDIIVTHKKTGAVNDKAIAEMKVASLRRSGRSQRFIQQKLAVKGLAKDLVAQTIAAHDGDEEQDADLKAAIAFCKKKRLGKFRPSERVKETSAKKDFAALARNGFSATVIKQVLNADFDEAEFD